MLEKIYKYGFYLFLFLLILFYWINDEISPYNNNGFISWVELYSEQAGETKKFFTDVLSLRTVSINEGYENEVNYLQSKDNLFRISFGVLKQTTESLKEKGIVVSSINYLTVKNYDEMHDKFLKNGAKEIISFQEDLGIKSGIYIVPGDIPIGIVQWRKDK
jgi:predicted enzyme related to lactoylglutathione lyase